MPWAGGFFKRLIKPIKTCLRKPLNVLKIDSDDLLTILVEIQRVINNRPLTYNYNDIDSEPLSSNHLIFGKRLDINYFTENSTSVEKNQFLEKPTERFCKLWNGEYLGLLREQHSSVKDKNHPKRDMICVDDIVLVSEKTPQIKWKYGLVEELIQGKERKIRGACVLIKDKDYQSIIRRPINKLYKLESSGSKATVQLEFIDEKEIKNVTSTK